MSSLVADTIRMILIVRIFLVMNNILLRNKSRIEFDIHQLMHFLYNNVLVYNVSIKTLKTLKTF